MHLSHRWFDCKMICFMAPLSRRYSLKMQSRTLWRSPSVGGSKLMRADQQSCALPGVLGTTLGPEIDFSHSISMIAKQSGWVMLRSHPWHVWREHPLFLSMPPSTCLKSAHLRLGLSLTCVASAFCALWVLTALVLGVVLWRVSFRCLCCSR